MTSIFFRLENKKMGHGSVMGKFFSLKGKNVFFFEASRSDFCIVQWLILGGGFKHFLFSPRIPGVS